MKISTQVLSIPPYISTSWKNIASLHLEGMSHEDVLIITLHSGARIEIPRLPAPIIEEIFSVHMQYLEQEESATTTTKPGHFSLEMLGMQNPLSPFSEMNPLIHDPSQANMPPLPEELLKKITEMAQSMGISEDESIPQPEGECACLRCQIARALQNGLHSQTKEEEGLPEEEVTDADLSFSSWKVSKENDKLYIVTHPEEAHEQYHVHLGNEIGCTCGQTRCEHIRAVLKT